MADKLNYKVGMIGALDMLRFKNMPKVREKAIQAASSAPLPKTLTTNEKAKQVMRVMDHVTIFLLIAGTYTPITLVTLRGTLGWVLFGFIWGAAALGIVLNAIDLERFRKISVVCYIIMGWAIIAAIVPLINSLPTISLVFLLIGGVLSAVTVLIINLVNSSGDTVQQMYVMPWLSFLILLAIAFGVILVIPLVCLLIMVYNIAKIQPQEAMNA